MYYRYKREKRAEGLFRRLLAVCCVLGLTVSFPPVTAEAAPLETAPLQTETVDNGEPDDAALAACAQQLNEELTRMLEYQQALLGQNASPALTDRAQQSVQILRQKQAQVLAQMALRQQTAQLAAQKQAAEAAAQSPALTDRAQQSVQILRQKQAQVLAQMALRQQTAQLAAQKQAAEAAAQQAAQKQAAEAAAQLAAQKQAAEAAAQLAAQQQTVQPSEGQLIAAGLWNNAPDSFFEGKALLAAQKQAAEAAAQLAAQQQTVQPSEGQLIAAGLWNNAPDSFFEGKALSILGDSISTYQGYIPSGYACYYPDADNNLKDVTQTWWMQVLGSTGMRLAVNGSYSASAVCGDSRGENSSAGCSNRRLSELIAPDGTVPEVILVYMGTNDFLFSIPLGRFSGAPVYRTDHYVWDFTEGYELMLQKLQAIYPASRIYCMTLLEQGNSKVNENGNTIADYNRRIREVAAAHGVPVIDLNGCGGVYTSDGIHPNKDGAAKIAAYVTNALFMGG